MITEGAVTLSGHRPPLQVQFLPRQEMLNTDFVKYMLHSGKGFKIQFERQPLKVNSIPASDLD